MTFNVSNTPVSVSRGINLVAMCFLLSILLITLFGFNVAVTYSREDVLDEQRRQAEQFYNKALKLFSENNFEEALSLFLKASELLPQNAEIWNHLGTSYYNLTKYEQAKEAFEQAYSYDAQNVEIMQNLALVHYKLGANEESLTLLEKILQSKPNAVPSLSLMGLI